MTKKKIEIMSYSFSNFTKDLKTFGDKISQEFNNEILPIAQRTSRLVQEKIGNLDNKSITLLPKEFLDLTEKCTKLEKFYKNILKVTTNYKNDGYDYPTNLQDSFAEFGKSVSDKFSNLTKSSSISDSESVTPKLTGKNAQNPKTIYHALSRACDISNFEIFEKESDHTFLKNINSYSKALNDVGNARLKQDNLIISKFNTSLNNKLKELFLEFNNLQRTVEKKRIDFDLARKNLSNCENPLKELQLRISLENAEDSFVYNVENTISLMRKIISHINTHVNFNELIHAQYNYHKKASEIFENIYLEFQNLNNDCEISSNDGDEIKSKNFNI